MAKIRKIDELDVVSEKLNIVPVTRGELTNLRFGKEQYIIKDIWYCEGDDEGFYNDFKMPIGDDLKKLVSKTLLNVCGVVVDTSKLTYVEYPDREIWVSYFDADSNTSYQCNVLVIRHITARELEKIGIQDDLAK